MSGKHGLTPTKQSLLRWRKLRTRASRAGIPFNLDPDDVIAPDYCPVLGIALHKGQGMGPKDYSPSVDRIDPSKGYVKGNVLVVSQRANRIKQDASPSEILAVGRFFTQLEKEKDDVHMDRDR